MCSSGSVYFLSCLVDLTTLLLTLFLPHNSPSDSSSPSQPSALRALTKPYKFDILPRRARPVPRIMGAYLGDSSFFTAVFSSLQQLHFILIQLLIWGISVQIFPQIIQEEVTYHLKYKSGTWNCSERSLRNSSTETSMIGSWWPSASCFGLRTFLDTMQPRTKRRKRMSRTLSLTSNHTETKKLEFWFQITTWIDRCFCN